MFAAPTVVLVFSVVLLATGSRTAAVSPGFAAKRD